MGEGATRKALDLLMSAGTHDPEDPAVLHNLRPLHPTAPPLPPSSTPPFLDPTLGDDSDGFWEVLVQDSISRFPRASAPGPSGLRPSHLQDAVRRRGRGLTLVSALAKLTKMWVHGSLPLTHAPYLNGASLTPLRKPDGGVRPVAVGETLRRLVGKALLSTSTLKEQVADLAPVQCGVGVSVAAENVAMGVRALVDTYGGSPNWAILKVDLKNAFNSVHRDVVLRGAHSMAPGAYNFLAYAYQQHAPLFIGATHLTSEQGTHQGCPLGPLGFALGVHDLLEGLAKDGGLIWSSWYLDDGILMGSPERLAHSFGTLREHLQKRGLEVNLAKCEVWGPAAPQLARHFPDVLTVPWTPASGIKVLGAPVCFPGCTVYQQTVWQGGKQTPTARGGQGYAANRCSAGPPCPASVPGCV